MKHYLGICLVLVTLAALVLFALHTCTAAVDETATNVASAFASVLKVQPQVTINERVVLTQTEPIAELAVVTKEELVTVGLDENLHVLAFQVPLTEKKLSAEATFRLKAGFDLHEPFSVVIDPQTHEVHATMPNAKILSVEQVGDVVLHPNDSLLNRISNEDQEAILKNLNDAAHAAAENSGLKDQAQEQVTQRLTDLLKHNGQTLQIDWQKEAVLHKQ
jgi:hypothetical protein